MSTGGKKLLRRQEAGKQVALPVVGWAGRVAGWIFVGLLAYMPLHIFLSTWLGTSFNVLPAAKVAKDAVLVIGFLGALTASLRQPWFKQLLKDKLMWLILAYAAWTLILAAIKSTDLDAEVLGVVYNLRFLLFFLYGLLLTKLFDRNAVIRKSLTAVLSVAAIVLFFGIVQYTALPDDALARVGYSRANGVLPAFFIDDKPDLERVMSTLRDPNSLGSYIIIIGSIALAFFLNKKASKQTTAGFLILCGLCLLFTFSRSAWLGFILSMVALGILAYKKASTTLRTKQLALIGVAVLLIGLPALYVARDSYLVQNVVLHADETTTLENPNELRARFWQESVNEVVDEPLGHGPGTAGLASIRNNVQGTNLNENYYLQIAHEVGLVGLALFLAIIGWTAWKLLALRKKPLARALLASFIGLAFTNFLVHIWSNEAVAYTWWGLAGLIMWKQK